MDNQDVSLAELVRKAQEAELQGDFALASATWAEVRTSYPDHAEAYKSGGRVARRAGQLTDAAEILATGVVRFPEDEWMAVDRAWTITDLARFQEARQLWNDIRAAFPESVSGYLGGAVSSRRVGEFDVADELYRDALSKFPPSESLLADFAWCAYEQGRLPEALLRWEKLHSLFPESAEGYIRCGLVLRELGRFDDADAILLDALAHFPDNPEVMMAYAWVPYNRGDWVEALKRWERVITSFPQLSEGRRLAAQVLMELGRFAEASAVLAPALRMEPGNADLATLNGWLALRWLDAGEAERIWREIRQHFPQDVDGYRGYAMALREMSRLDESDAVLTDAVARFPDDSLIAIDFAEIPEKKRDWKLAIERWRAVLDRFPDLVYAYSGLANSLIETGDVAGAQAVFKAGMERLPDDPGLAAAEASAAARLADWPRALTLWETLQTKYPQLPLGYLGLGKTLRESGELDRSALALEDAIRRFPNDVDLEIELALTLSYQRKWPTAIALWESLKQRFPGNGDVRRGVSLIFERALVDQASGHFGSFEIPPLVLSNDQEAGSGENSLTELFKHFESLGDSCEFAMLQRVYRVDSVSLLRWSETPPDHLITALDTRFEGVGEPEHTIITVNSDEYITEDRRYGMQSHTFTPPSSEPLEVFAAEQCRRLQWLRRKLIADLTAAKKIYVYKSDDGVTDSQLSALKAAIARYNPKNILFCVRLAEPDHPVGKLIRVDERLFVGYIDKFSTVNISVNTWIGLCKAVREQVSETKSLLEGNQ